MGFPGMNYSNKNRVKGQRPGMGQAPPSPYMGGPAGGGNPSQGDPNGGVDYMPGGAPPRTRPPGPYAGPYLGGYNGPDLPPGMGNQGPKPKVTPGGGGVGGPGPRPFPPGYSSPPNPNPGTVGRPPGYLGPPVRNRQIQGGYQGPGPGFGGVPGGPGGPQGPPPAPGPDPRQLAEMLPWDDPRSPHYQGPRGRPMTSFDYGQMEDTEPTYFPYANMLAGY